MALIDNLVAGGRWPRPGNASRSPTAAPASTPGGGETPQPKCAEVQSAVRVPGPASTQSAGDAPDPDRTAAAILADQRRALLAQGSLSRHNLAALLLA